MVVGHSWLLAHSLWRRHPFGPQVRFVEEHLVAAAGWFKLWRKIGEHWLWKRRPFSPGQAWIDLLIRVNFTAKAIPAPGRAGPATLQPGEAIVSLRLLE